MSQLRNLKSREELAKERASENFARRVLSFYKYVDISEPQQFRDQLFTQWNQLNVCGRVYVAKEGINAQISVPAPHWQAFESTIQENPHLAGIFFNFAIDEKRNAFLKLKIKVRERIVADAFDDGLIRDPDLNKTPHLQPSDFHHLLQHKEAIPVDVRNVYECETGHFENAFCPEGETFKEILPEIADKLKDKKDKPLLLYCTGGIRCEKASAYLTSKGFSQLNQLKGGILNYVKWAKENGEESKYKGSIFVFDERMAEPTGTVISKCYQCGEPHDTHRDCNNEECHRLIIQCPTCEASFSGCCSETCQAAITE